MKTNRLTEISLTPAQQRALDGLLEGLRVGSTVVLQGRPGAGKTTILENVHRATAFEFTRQLRKIGKPVDLIVIREGQRMKLIVTPEARK